MTIEWRIEMNVYILFKHETYQYGVIDEVLYVFASEEEANKAAEQLNREGGSSFVQFYVEEHEVV